MKEGMLIKFLCWVQPMLAAITFLEAIDTSVRIVTGSLTVVISFFIIRHYRNQYSLYKQDTKLKQLDIQIKEQTLFDQIESNKKKHG
jgi:hypothetical protein